MPVTTYSTKSMSDLAQRMGSAMKVLLDKDIITQVDGAYQVYDKFFAYWLKREVSAGRV